MVVQVPPWLTLEPSAHDWLSAFRMSIGGEHGLPRQAKVDDVKAPALQLKLDWFAVYPALHIGVQLTPWFTIGPSAQVGLAAFTMPVGAQQGSGEHENADGVKSPKLQFKLETLAL